jgi:HAD superfamily hydrolase (TIGR01509 family)
VGGVSFDAVVFDNDGLLLDTEEAWTRAEEDLFTRHGAQFTMEHKKTLLGTSFETSALLLEAMLDRPGQGTVLLGELQRFVLAEAAAGVPARPGALALVGALREAGVPLAVASNSERPFVEGALGAAGLLDGTFLAVVTATDVEHHKPAPDLYLRACELLGADPARCAALEDSVPGVASARAAGLYTIGVPYFSDGRLPEADLQVGSLADDAVYVALGLREAAA